jgi:hypothetical protein
VSVHKMVLISCDHRIGTGTCHKYIEIGQAQSSRARRQAKRAGWRTDKDKDFCPIHGMA